MNGKGSAGSGRGGGQYRNACLTMHQPWASLLIHGIKRIEGRSWRAPLTGRLWIHAASKVPEPETIKQMEKFYRTIYAEGEGITDIKFPEHYPVSHLLGCVEIVGCLKDEELKNWEEVPQSVRSEALTGFCWLCENPQKLVVPFEMRGYQGVYNLENKNSLSLKQGSLLSKASEVKKSESLAEAIAGARAAAAQFSRKEPSRSAVKEQKHQITRNQAVVVADGSNRTPYNLRSGRTREESQPLSSERKLMSGGVRDALSQRSGPRILTPNGSTKLFSEALKGMTLRQ